MSVYVAGDCRFGENSARDRLLVQEWNELLKEDDEILFMGEFWTGEWVNERVADLLGFLNASALIVDYKYERYGERSKEELEVVGFDGVYSIYINVQDELILASEVNDILREKSVSKKLKLAAPRSTTQNTEVLQDNILSVSIEDWGDSVVDLDALPALFTNISNFKEGE